MIFPTTKLRSLAVNNFFYRKLTHLQRGAPVVNARKFQSTNLPSRFIAGPMTSPQKQKSQPFSTHKSFTRKIWHHWTFLFSRLSGHWNASKPSKAFIKLPTIYVAQLHPSCAAFQWTCGVKFSSFATLPNSAWS